MHLQRKQRMPVTRHHACAPCTRALKCQAVTTVRGATATPRCTTTTTRHSRRRRWTMGTSTFWLPKSTTSLVCCVKSAQKRIDPTAHHHTAPHTEIWQEFFHQGPDGKPPVIQLMAKYGVEKWFYRSTTPEGLNNRKNIWNRRYAVWGGCLQGLGGKTHTLSCITTQQQGSGV